MPKVKRQQHPDFNERELLLKTITIMSYTVYPQIGRHSDIFVMGWLYMFRTKKTLWREITMV